MERKRLMAREINASLGTLNGWSVKKDKLHKRFTFPNFAESLDFVNKIGRIAETADHHPDISFGWGYAEITTTTHDRGGITDVDFALAKQIDTIWS